MYRADIDGLRAVAVISVLFYHFGVMGFSGGFVGVDVFFVISGFLITQLLYVEIQEERFSFVEFYGRRARRLFPAFFFVIVMSFITAYILFTPEHMARFSGSVVYALGSMSNFYFWGESGYFDASANIKPLLHTWTLGVEEQFYFVWPFILFFLVKNTYKAAAPIFLFTAGVISLFYSERLLSSQPDAAFYLVPFRVFEFVMGGVLVWLIRFKTKNRIVSESISVIGLAMIVYAVLSYTDATLFPGVGALLPCLGAAMIIYNTESKIIGKLLSNGMMVKVGLISYSLYLIHWPVIVFYKYYKFDINNSLTSYEVITLLVAIFVAALLMHKYIEIPFRKKTCQGKTISAAAFGFICAISSVMLMIPAASSWASGGWLWRYADLSDIARNELRVNNDDFKLYAYKKIIELDKKPFSNNSKKKVLIIGDSQAGDFINMIYENKFHETVDLSAIVIGAKCQPVFLDTESEDKYIPLKYEKVCNAQRNKYIESNKLNQADVVVLAASWRRWGVAALGNTVDKLRGLGIKEVYVVGPKAQGESGQTLLARFGRRDGLEEFSSARRDVGSKRMSTALELGVGYFYINILEHICPEKEYCHVLTPSDKVIFYDKSHVTPEGAQYIGRILYDSGELAFLK